MLCVICVVRRIEWRNFQNATSCFGIQPCRIGTYFNMLQRCIVFRRGEDCLAIRIYRAIGIGMAIATGGMLLLAAIPEGATQVDIAWRMALCGAGYGLFLSPNAKLVISAAPIARAASAGGLISTNRLAGQALGAVTRQTFNQPADHRSVHFPASPRAGHGHPDRSGHAERPAGWRYRSR